MEVPVLCVRSWPMEITARVDKYSSQQKFHVLWEGQRFIATRSVLASLLKSGQTQGVTWQMEQGKNVFAEYELKDDHLNTPAEILELERAYQRYIMPVCDVDVKGVRYNLCDMAKPSAVFDGPVPELSNELFMEITDLVKRDIVHTLEFEFLWFGEKYTGTRKLSERDGAISWQVNKGVVVFAEYRMQGESTVPEVLALEKAYANWMLKLKLKRNG